MRQGRQGLRTSPRVQGRGLNRFAITAPGDQPCPHVGVGLPASRTGRQPISVSATLFVALCYGSTPREPRVMTGELRGLREDYSGRHIPFCVPRPQRSGVDQAVEVREQTSTTSPHVPAAPGFSSTFSGLPTPRRCAGVAQSAAGWSLQARHDPSATNSHHLPGQHKPVLCRPKPCPSPSQASPRGLGPPVSLHPQPPWGGAVFGHLGCGHCDTYTSSSLGGGARAQAQCAVLGAGRALRASLERAPAAVTLASWRSRGENSGATGLALSVSKRVAV